MSHPFQLPLARRLRRLRQQPSIRKLVEETVVTAADLIQPLFVIEGDSECEPIASLPGQQRRSIPLLVEECKALFTLGIPAVAIFPKLHPTLKDAMGSEALNPDTLILRAVKAVKQAVPELVVITDIALDPYTDHGHDGLLNPGASDVDNDRTVEVLARMAVLHAQAGADFVAPSDMMDGRVDAIREALDSEGLTEIAIMAYAAKFSSAFYGPFRDAVGSQQQLNKATYQCNPANRREALLEAQIDEEEGADVLMIKPAGPYLDIIRDVRNHTLLPIAAYQVSGEYSQIHAAAAQGWLNFEQCRDESLLAIKRAGADMILTYFAKEVAQ